MLVDCGECMNPSRLLAACAARKLRWSRPRPGSYCPGSLQLNVSPTEVSHHAPAPASAQAESWRHPKQYL